MTHSIVEYMLALIIVILLAIWLGSTILLFLLHIWA